MEFADETTDVAVEIHLPATSVPPTTTAAATAATAATPTTTTTTTTIPAAITPITASTTSANGPASMPPSTSTSIPASTAPTPRTEPIDSCDRSKAETETEVSPQNSWLTLPTIVFAQFAGTSLWFAPNAVISQIPNFGDTELTALTAIVQAGFILGTFVLGYFAVADRFPGPLVFTFMALIGAGLNILCVTTTNFAAWAILRLLVGISLAGIYPMGMKIAAKQYPQGLGARLGLLVGALTLGTAFPWLVRGVSSSGALAMPYKGTLATVSILALLGGVLMSLVLLPSFGLPAIRDLCSHRQLSQTEHCTLNANHCTEPDLDWKENKNNLAESDHDDHDDHDQRDKPKQCKSLVDISLEDSLNEQETSEKRPRADRQEDVVGLAMLRTMCKDKPFVAAALGYWGHMWELYTFWAFVPALIKAHQSTHAKLLSGELTTFASIAIGSISCTLAGVWSLYAGNDRIPGSAVAAWVSLFVSGVCCVLAPFYKTMPSAVFFIYVLVWGFAVVADSGQFSSLSAKYAPPNLIGTALMMTTCVGFTITIISIQLVGNLNKSGLDIGWCMLVLAPGPLIGLLVSYRAWPLHTLLINR